MSVAVSIDRKTTIKSFRLESKLIKLLTSTTRRVKTSESAYVSSILEMRLKREPLIQNMKEITLKEELFQEILAQTNPAGLEILASEIARKDIPYTFELLGLQLSPSSVLWYFREILQDCGWFKMQVTQGHESYELKMFHNNGIKWSMFLKSYLMSLYEMISNERAQVTIGDRIVKVRLNGQISASEVGLLIMPESA